jgi:DNA replication protein DnaC
MNTVIETKLDLLGLRWLKENWSSVMTNAINTKPSYQKFLEDIITEESAVKHEQKRVNRIKAARIPEIMVINTFPFPSQPKLKKNLVMQVYDSLSFIKEHSVLLFIGPTGCGKTGLATSFLVHALNNGYKGLFIDFKDLLLKLYRSGADRSTARVIKVLANLDCLLIDEFGYDPLDDQMAGLYFDLIKTRHKRKCTIITSQLGFDNWKKIIRNEHVNAAIIDRITEHCIVFNMNKGVSLRKKNIVYGTEQDKKQD